MSEISFGSRLRYCRENLQPKRNQEEIARDLGVSRTYLSDLERDVKQPSHELLARIVEYYKTSFDYLYGYQAEYPLFQDRELLDYTHTMNEQSRASLLEIAKILAQSSSKADKANLILEKIRELGGEEMLNRVLDSLEEDLSDDDSSRRLSSSAFG